MRAKLMGQDNLDFANYLLKIGEGHDDITVDVDEQDVVMIPPELRAKAKNLDEFGAEIFPRLRERVESGLKNQFYDDQEWIDWLVSRAIIVPTNEAAQEVNDNLMGQLSGEEMVYKSADKVTTSKKSQGKENAEIADDLKFPVEYLNSITLSSMPPHRLVLKCGAPVMLIRNLDPHNGHVNGSRYVIKSMHKHLIHAQLAAGPHKGKDILFPRIYFSPKNTVFQMMQRKQFPVRPCFAITSHKSQGQTMENVGIYIKKDKEFFGHGQLYVAMSRVGSFKRLKIFKSPVTDKESKYMKNVVFKTILK